MNFKVDKDCRGNFLIYINRERTPAIAKTTTEVRTALEHYCGKGTYYGHPHHFFNNPRCPLCRSIMERDK